MADRMRVTSPMRARITARGAACKCAAGPTLRAAGGFANLSGVGPGRFAPGRSRERGAAVPRVVIVGGGISGLALAYGRVSRLPHWTHRLRQERVLQPRREECR